MNYILKHWRGELSLKVSFWVNVFLLNLFTRGLDAWFTESPPISHPQTAAQVTLAYLIVFLTIIYPWQVVGLWRACTRHIAQTGRTGWARTAQGLTVVGILMTLGNLHQYWPVYKDIYQIGFGKDKYANYKVELNKDGSLVSVQGDLGFGVSKEVAELLRKHPAINGIILDSAGGRIYEGRELSRLISISNLDTYSLKGCYSACTTAFIAGKNRYLSTEANLAFHQYGGYKNLEAFVDIKREQEEDLRIFRRQGVAPEFLARLFETAHDDPWYPTKQELLDARVIKGIVNTSDLTPITYQQSAKDFSDAFLSFSAYKAIRRFDPETYKRIVAALDEQIRKGASQIEIQNAVASHVASVATRTMPQSSNEALIKFVKILVVALRKLEQKDPIACLKYLYPKQYGAVNLATYLSKEDLETMTDAMSNVILDAYEKKNPPVNTKSAEILMERIVTRLGKDALYLEPSGLQNREQYRKHCEVVIKFYELILSEDKTTSGNGLRFVFRQ